MILTFSLILLLYLSLHLLFSSLKVLWRREEEVAGGGAVIFMRYYNHRKHRDRRVSFFRRIAGWGIKLRKRTLVLTFVQ